MKVAIVLVCLAATAFALTESEYQREFISFARQFDKTYASDQMFKQFGVFKDNLDYIVAHNNRNESYTLGVNEFSDMTHEEFLAAYVGGFRAVETNQVAPEAIIPLAPNDVDWRGKAVTPVKNQGQCGSCWAFGATGGVEGAWAITKGKLVSLSEQQLVDCAGSAGNQGCGGGFPSSAYDWIVKNGICDSASYPYTGRDGTCKKTCTAVAQISGYSKVGTTDAAHVAAVTKQPLSIGIDASARDFQSYKSGVFGGPCGKSLNHAVLTVGYNANAFIVKNSWGASWGDQGFIQMARNKNVCGMFSVVNYPNAK